ncbi:hypothetical protein ACFFSY_00540 [Paenibacillus aurantiacus]|uniref:ATP-binding protein n=1 Tax=Paenibacillus aurantiacus TaxID=1936118 RepID=A0ABV5KGS9_9BACL
MKDERRSKHEEQSERIERGIGARWLPKEVVKLMLPSIDQLVGQIDSFREVAAAYQEQRRASDYHREETPHRRERPEFNNTIAVLGDRGTGKTTVLHSLKKNEIEGIQPYDTLTPFIVPEQMSPASTILGWILSSLRTEVESINQDYYEWLRRSQDNRDRRGWDRDSRAMDACIRSDEETPLRVAYKKAVRQYHLRTEQFARFVARRDEGAASYVTDNEKIINADLELIDSFHDLIDALVEAKSKLYGDKLQKDSDTPLVFIFFDDVDISAERAGEVLETIINFLTHPNIVTFITGYYKVFAEAMTLHLLQKEKVGDPAYLHETILPAHLGTPSENTTLRLRQERSEEFLKKAFRRLTAIRWRG